MALVLLFFPWRLSCEARLLHHSRCGKICGGAEARRHCRGTRLFLQEANTPAAITNATLQERVRLFWRLAVPYFEQADGAKLNFGLMLLLVLVNSGISVIFSFVGRDFYSALSAKDQALFLEKTANFAVGLAVATPLTVLYKFQRQRLALNWREWMTTSSRASTTPTRRTTRSRSTATSTTRTSGSARTSPRSRASRSTSSSR